MNYKKSRVLIVLGSNIHWAPYYYRYDKLLKNMNIQYDLLLWNRENIEEKNGANKLFEYKMKDKSNNKNPFKIIKFITFCNYVKKIINNNKYEKILFLGTHGCAPVFLCRYLKNKYNCKYWLDIRDYQYEWFKPYYNMEKKAIINSYVTVLSSKGYKRFLPQHSYKYIHNIDPNIEDFVKKIKITKCDKIRISFIGNIRYYDENIKLLQLFKNDNRFILQYYGAGFEKIKKYCEDNDIRNVDFGGKFNQEDTVNFYNNTDIINNVYGNSNIGLTTALSNKLYYSLYFKIPILVCKNTYMEEVSVKNGFGFSVEYNSDYPNKLYDLYNQYKKSKPNYDNVRLEIEEQEKTTIKLLKKFLNYSGKGE